MEHLSLLNINMGTSLVASHIGETSKCLLTKLTGKGFFSCVGFEVIRETFVLTI